MEGVMLWGRTCLFLLSKGNVAALEAFEDGEKRQNNINMQIEGATGKVAGWERREVMCLWIAGMLCGTSIDTC